MNLPPLDLQSDVLRTVLQSQAFIFSILPISISASGSVFTGSGGGSTFTVTGGVIGRLIGVSLGKGPEINQTHCY